MDDAHGSLSESGHRRTKRRLIRQQTASASPRREPTVPTARAQRAVGWTLLPRATRSLYRASIGVTHGFARRSGNAVEVSSFTHSEVVMIFPQLASATNPFPSLDGGQSTARSDPPRSEIDRDSKRLTAFERPPRIIRIYVVGLSTATMLHRAIHGKAVMRVPAPAAGPQPRPRFSRYRPVSGLTRWSDPRIVGTPEALSRLATSTHCLTAGPTVCRRGLPGHLRHHRPHRNVCHDERWHHRRRARRAAATSTDAHRRRGARRPRVHSNPRRAAMSGPDQEPGESRAKTRPRALTGSYCVVVSRTG